MSAVVLDAEALNVLVSGAQGERVVRTWLEAARRTGCDVLVPAAVLAELYRTARHEAAVDSLLAREPGFAVADTDRHLARTVGRLLSQAGRGSADHVDATVVAVAAERGRSVIITSDGDDIEAIAAGTQVTVVTLN
jgi:predicted nucleic acid-binding protein